MSKRRRFGRREMDMSGQREARIDNQSLHHHMPIREPRAGEGGRVVLVVMIGNVRRICVSHGEGLMFSVHWLRKRNVTLCKLLRTLAGKSSQ